MMAITSSFSVLVQTETTGLNVSRKYLRARSAALSGVGYVIGQMAATTTTFLGHYKERYYFLYASSTPDLTARLAGTGIAATGFSATIVSQWYYAISQNNPVPDELATSMLFKVTSYPNANGPATSAYIKSIGRYYEIESNAILATWTAEVIARIKISTDTETISIDYWQPLPVEACQLSTDPFFTVGQRP